MKNEYTLSVWHSEVGNFPDITFDFQTKLIGISLSHAYELYFLLENHFGCKFVVNAEDCFLEEPINLGYGPASLRFDVVYMLKDDFLWQQVIGKTSWDFVTGAKGARNVLTFPSPSPIAAYPDISFILVYDTKIEYSNGEQYFYDDFIRSADCGNNVCVVLSGDCLYQNHELVSRGCAHVNAVFVRGNDVYLCIGQESVIFQHDASRYDHEPRINLQDQPTAW